MSPKSSDWMVNLLVKIICTKFAFSGKDKYWVGAEPRWAWLVTKAEPTYTKWHDQNQPKENEQFCALLKDKKWKSDMCDKGKGYICEKAESSPG
jgi:hypothetical protein